MNGTYLDSNFFLNLYKDFIRNWKNVNTDWLLMVRNYY